MCGISGVFGRTDTDFVVRATDCQYHRGRLKARPVSYDNICTLGHNRLAIVGDYGSNQPFECEYVAITFNGEIYNYLDIKSSLIRKGHRFKTKSDAEVIARSYIEYGPIFLEKLKGMFGFALLDRRENKLLLCRDRVGIKPLYYHMLKDSVVFASEAKALQEFSNQVNNYALNEYVSFQYCVGSKTLFNGINKVRPGEYLVFDGDLNCSHRFYWEVSSDSIRKSKCTYYASSYYEDKLFSLLYDGVRSHVPVNTEFGVYVSGGFDSSSVAGLVSEHTTKTFLVSGRYDYKDCDESIYVKALRSDVDGELFLLTITEDMVCDVLEKCLYQLDEPCAGPGVLGQYVLAEAVRQEKPDLKVMLGGQGGDELFGGYSRYLVAYLESCIWGSIYPNSKDYVLDLHRVSELMPSLRGYEPMLKSFFSGMFSSDRDRRYMDLICRNCGNLREDFKYGYDKDFGRIEEEFLQVFNNLGDVSYLTKMLYYDFKNSLPALLQVDDRVNAAFEIESRVPLLDSDVVDFSFSIPPVCKIESSLKGLFKRSVSSAVPECVRNRTDKMGFPIPLDRWYGSKGRFYELVNDSKGLGNDVFSKTYYFDRSSWGRLSLNIWSERFL